MIDPALPRDGGSRKPPTRDPLFFLVVLGAFAGLWSMVSIGTSSATQPAFSSKPARQSRDAPFSTTQADGRTKIAEGEYALVEEANSGAAGPFDEEVYNFHENWTLWRVPRQQYEVVGERQFESPKDVPEAHNFLVQLSRDLTVLRVTEFAKLKWRKDSGPLTCEFLRTALHCSSGARDSRQAIELRIPSDRPFGLLWPISVFSLSGLARQAERDPGHPEPIRLISITQPSAAQPIYPETLDGQLQYLGEEQLQAAGVKWQAHKFSIRVPLHPQFLLWTSDRGLLLALAVEHGDPNWPKEGLRLARFHQWADF